MDQIKTKKIITTIKEINSQKVEELLLKIIQQIVNLISQIVDNNEKNHKIILELQSLKNNINDIYSINSNHTKKIKEIIDIFNDNDPTKRSIRRTATFENVSKYNDDFTIIKKDGKDIIKFRSGEEYEGELKGKITMKGNAGDNHICHFKNIKK